MVSQKEYFSKLDKSSVAIRVFYTFGVSVGIKKPVYYYVIFTDPTTGEEYTYLELFDTDNTHGVYYSDAPFFYGLSEIKIVPGLNFKSGVSFEFGNTDRKIRAIELGVFAQVYIKQIDIMASDDNTSYFAGLFLQYRFGKIVNKRLRNTPKEQ
ncbi:MAG: hypothetical protein IPO21_07050 [Bacteroidales bacterium]|nr:hypothetical protein [Bacteroidales bacterium]